MSVLSSKSKVLNSTNTEPDLTIQRLGEPRGLIYPAPGYHYKILNRENGIKGFSDLAIYTVQQLHDRGSFFAALVRNGMYNNDLVTEIVNFYPHGRNTDNKEAALYRKGVGSLVFELMHNDSIKSGARVIISYVTSDEMRAFLTKRDFEKVGPGSSCYLKIL